MRAYSFKATDSIKERTLLINGPATYGTTLGRKAQTHSAVCEHFRLVNMYTFSDQLTNRLTLREITARAASGASREHPRSGNRLLRSPRRRQAPEFSRYCHSKRSGLGIAAEHPLRGRTRPPTAEKIFPEPSTLY